MKTRQCHAVFTFHEVFRQALAILIQYAKQCYIVYLLYKNLLWSLWDLSLRASREFNPVVISEIAAILKQCEPHDPCLISHLRWTRTASSSWHLQLQPALWWKPVKPVPEPPLYPTPPLTTLPQSLLPTPHRTTVPQSLLHSLCSTTVAKYY